MRRNIVMVSLAVCVILGACGNESDERSADEISFQSVETGMSEPQESKNENQVSAGENGDGQPTDEAAVNAELEGNIESIEDGGFTIAKIDIEEKDNGAQIAVANLGDKTFVRVTYNAATKFVICTVLDGINGQYTDAAASDLQEGRNVVLEGTYNDAGFAAQKVTIYDFR